MLGGNVAGGFWVGVEVVVCGVGVVVIGCAEEFADSCLVMVNSRLGLGKMGNLRPAKRPAAISGLTASIGSRNLRSSSMAVLLPLNVAFNFTVNTLS